MGEHSKPSWFSGCLITFVMLFLAAVIIFLS